MWWSLTMDASASLYSVNSCITSGEGVNCIDGCGLEVASMAVEVGMH